MCGLPLCSDAVVGYGLGIGTQGWTRWPLALGAVMATIVGAACTDDGSGDGISAQPVLALDQGDIGVCLEFDDDVGAEITELPRVPNCAVEHTHEIFATPILDAKEYPLYPGFDALEAIAQAQCLDAFEDYVEVSPFDSSLFTSWIVPTLTSWDKEDDRQIICVVGNGDGAPLVATVKASQR